MDDGGGLHGAGGKGGLGKVAVPLQRGDGGHKVGVVPAVLCRVHRRTFEAKTNELRLF